MSGRSQVQFPDQPHFSHVTVVKAVKVTWVACGLSSYEEDLCLFRLPGDSGIRRTSSVG